MKWKNRGHEYDSMYQKINEKQSFYLFGAGDYGNQFWNIFKNEINIKGYIDNASDKQGTEINGKYCYALYEIDTRNHDKSV